MITHNIANQQMMMNMLGNDPNLLSKFNQFLANQNQMQQHQFSSSLTGEKSLRNMKPNPETMRMMFDMDNPAPKVNMVFQVTVGTKFRVIAPNTMKLKDLFINFMTNLGFSTDIIGKTIYFVFNANKLDPNENRTIKEMKIIDSSLILIIDLQNLIGAK